MSKSLSVIFLIIALTTGYIATLSITNYVNANRVAVASNEQVDQSQVVVAAFNIPIGTTLRKEHLRTRNFPSDLISGKTFSSSEPLEGRVVGSTIYQGELILENRLQPEGAIGGLSGLIPEGQRAITLRVDDTSSVAGFVKPGNHVDVVTTLRRSNTGEPISKVILQNVKVIATGSEIEPAENEKEEAKVIPTVTVLATLDQTERLSLASTEGKIRLVLRNHLDQRQELTNGTTLSNLIPQADTDPAPPQPTLVVMPEPSPTPRPRRVIRTHKVELYEGKSKEVFEFRQ